VTADDNAPAGTGASSENSPKASDLDVSGHLPMANPPDVQIPEQRKRLIHLLGVVDDYHLVDDPGLHCFCLAVCLSAFRDGDPLWGMPVGPAGSGKTSALQVVSPIASRHVDQVTVAGLLHWHRNKPGSRPVPKGILIDVGERGFVTVSDFSVVLEGGCGEERSALYSFLRTIYDGEVSRDISGGDGGPLHWEGRLTFLACCTSAIDNFSSFLNALGPRFLYYRLAYRDLFTKRAVMRKARSAGPPGAKLARAQELAVALMVEVVEVVNDVHLSSVLDEQIEDASIVAAYGRAVVPRDYRREIDGVPEPEEPTRLAKQLTTLTTCLIAIGLSDPEAVAMASKVALDCMPWIRRRVLEVVAESEPPATATSVAKLLNFDVKTVTRALVDLKVIGLIEEIEEEEPSGTATGWSKFVGLGQPDSWRLAEEQAGVVRGVVRRAKIQGS